MTVWRRKTSVFVVLALLTSLGLVACSSGDKQVDKTFTVNGTSVTVKATITDGEITATPVEGELPTTGLVTALASPIHLEVEGGQLNGPATITFPVDLNKLPASVDPEAWLNVMVRSERTGGQWLWAGGDYNAENQTITVQTEGFSDWTYGVTDFAKIRADLAWSQENSIGLRLARTVWGDIPALECDDSQGQIGLTYAVNDPSPPPMKVCYTLNEGINEYYLEISNTHSFPFLLTLPPGLEVQTNVVQGAGIMGDAYAVGRWLSDKRAVLGAEQKLTFIADKADFDAIDGVPTITGTVDWTALSVDLVSFMLDLTGLDMAESVQQLEDSNSALKQAYDSALNSKAALDCLDRQAVELADNLSGDTVDSIVEQAKNLATNCYDFTVGPIVELIQDYLGIVSKRASAGIRWITKRFAILTSLSDIGRGIREYGSGMIVGVEELNTRDSEVGVEIALLGKIPYDELYHVLPGGAVSRGYGFIRQNAPTLMPYECAAGGGFELETTRDPLTGNPGYKHALASYDVQGGALSVSLFKVISGPEEAWSYVAGMKEECADAFPDGSFRPPSYQQVLRGDEGDAHRVYEERWGDETVEDSYLSISYSNGYFLVTSFTPTGDGQLERFNAARQRINQSVDRYLVTTFSK